MNASLAEMEIDVEVTTLGPTKFMILHQARAWGVSVWVGGEGGQECGWVDGWVRARRPTWRVRRQGARVCGSPLVSHTHAHTHTHTHTHT